MPTKRRIAGVNIRVFPESQSKLLAAAKKRGVSIAVVVEGLLKQ